MTIRLSPVLLELAASLGALLLCALPACLAGEPPLRLVYEQTVSAPSGGTTRSAVVYAICPERTIIRREGEETIIDYRGLALTRKRAGSSVEYPLNPPGTGEEQPRSLKDELMRRVATYRLGEAGPGQSIHGLPATEREIWFGVGLGLARTAMPVTVEYFGQRFGERRVQCAVSQMVVGYATLAAIARDRRMVARANPLLLQLDPSNLILLLDGLPIRLREQRGNAIHTLALQSP